MESNRDSAVEENSKWPYFDTEVVKLLQFVSGVY